MAKKKLKRPSRKKTTQAKLVTLSPELEAVFMQGRTAHQQGQGLVAKAAYEHVLAGAPKHAQTHFLLAILLMGVRDFAQSEAHFLKAVALLPSEPDFTSGLANLYSNTKQYDKAAYYFTQALEAKPDDPDLMANLSGALLKIKQFSKAKRLLTKVLERDPNHKIALNNMATALYGLPSSAEYYQRAMKAFPERFELRSNWLMGLNYLQNWGPKEVYEEHASLVDVLPSPEALPFQEKEKIRIGYLSGDFRQHSVAYFLLPLLAQHDRQQFEIYCYYSKVAQDSFTEKFKALSDGWREVEPLNDAELCQLVRGDSVDILVELSGHSGGHRMLALAARIAPIQVSWLGYPHSTGVPAIDYRIVDDITDPAPKADAYASETLMRLPESFLCYQGDEFVAYQSSPPYKENGYLTFGSFNNLLKVNEDVLGAWAEILRQVPNSRMIIKAKQLSEPDEIKRIKAYFEREGVALERLKLSANFTKTEHHLALYNSIDLALDTFPYNGTTTTFEALWMGVPTLCILGDRHAARVSASIMTRAGLEQFVCENREDYCQRAVALSREPEQLERLRPQLREQLKASTLCDAERFTRSMEAAYQSMLEPKH